MTSTNMLSDKHRILVYSDVGERGHPHHQFRGRSKDQAARMLARKLSTSWRRTLASLANALDAPVT